MASSGLVNADGGYSQASLAATTLTTIYESVVRQPRRVTHIIFCNRTGGALTVRLSIAADGAADDVSQYIVYDKSIAANDYLLLDFGEKGLPLGKEDEIRAYASGAGISVTVVDEKRR